MHEEVNMMCVCLYLLLTSNWSCPCQACHEQQEEILMTFIISIFFHPCQPGMPWARERCGKDCEMQVCSLEGAGTGGELQMWDFSI